MTPSTLLRTRHHASTVHSVSGLRALRKKRLTTALRMVGILAITVVVGLPVWVTFASALMPSGVLAKSGVIPDLSRLTLDNFRAALDVIPLLRQYAVSIGVVSVQTFGQIFIAALAAYALVFPRWRGRALLFGLVLFTMAIPSESIVIPTFEIVSDMGLRDTIAGVVIPFLAAGYPIFLLRQAFASVSFEVWEAAKLDGCSDLRALFQIVLPSCKPQLTTAVLWSALGAWNGFFWPLLITDSANSRTVQVGLSQLATAETSDPAVIFAGTALVLIPTVLLVVVAQRFLINGLSRGVLH